MNQLLQNLETDHIQATLPLGSWDRLFSEYEWKTHKQEKRYRFWKYQTAFGLISLLAVFFVPVLLPIPLIYTAISISLCLKARPQKMVQTLPFIKAFLAYIEAETTPDSQVEMEIEGYNHKNLERTFITSENETKEYGTDITRTVYLKPHFKGQADLSNGTEIKWIVSDFIKKKVQKGRKAKVRFKKSTFVTIHLSRPRQSHHVTTKRKFDIPLDQCLTIDHFKETFQAAALKLPPSTNLEPEAISA